MLPSEYAKLMGLESFSLEEFKLAEAIYLKTPLDKYEFCEDYKKHKGSTIIQCLYKNCEHHLDEYLSLREKYSSLKEKYYQLRDKYDALRFDIYEAKGGW